MTYARKTDLVQKEIVDGLRKYGYRVEIIERPVDLLVGKPVYNPHIVPSGYRWHLLELKTPAKNGKRRNRKDQAKQDQFLTETGTPVVCTLEAALTVLRGIYE
jgi:hypothetical protein